VVQIFAHAEAEHHLGTADGGQELRAQVVAAVPQYRRADLPVGCPVGRDRRAPARSSSSVTTSRAAFECSPPPYRPGQVSPIHPRAAMARLNSRSKPRIQLSHLGTNGVLLTNSRTSARS
jgi:hypothetical protein